MDALELAGQILKDRGIPRPAREKLSDLLVFLGGHPLSIQLVVPHLRTNTPDKLIAEFDALYPASPRARARNATRACASASIFRCGVWAKRRAKCCPIWPCFRVVQWKRRSCLITGFKPCQWRRLRDELARAALLTIDQGAAIGRNTDEGNFSGYYVRFHPTLLPYLTPQLTPANAAPSWKHAMRKRITIGCVRLSVRQPESPPHPRHRHA